MGLGGPWDGRGLQRAAVSLLASSGTQPSVVGVHALASDPLRFYTTGLFCLSNFPMGLVCIFVSILVRILPLAGRRRWQGAMRQAAGRGEEREGGFWECHLR